ncbi:hypothetical protein Misp01_41010 [Microtetraspora sp. NBRC 13810]|uniref:hypothetical protein n=1 Tax=Microtetraspora sp. NBRC 13810 TaxID=3030990 RepID=UPI0025522A71|nr:hypothetical protein [Microtetraspora sp. NBRC 13810]GLW08971.1 hypothetical protein Misp01_41010 [Microtetraspora sp. NBRC 13810]
MISVLVYLLVFFAGGLFSELVRMTQERYCQWQVARLPVHSGGSIDAISRIWASRPETWCNRRGCPRCWGRRWSR